MFDGIAALPRPPAAKPSSKPQRLAVVGSGVAGLSAAWLLGRHHHVTLYEAETAVGGHARTVHVPGVGTDGRDVAVDAGFMVFNRKTYPHLVRLFELLNIASQPSDMSFGVSVARPDIEYAGSRDPRLLFAQPRNVMRPAFLGMIRDLLRFYKQFRQDAVMEDISNITLGDYLSANGYGAAFIDWHILPMAAAIWSGSPRSILNFPAATFGNFFRNHGLLDLAERPQWLTVAGRSQRYVQVILNDFTGTIRCAAPVVSVRRQNGNVMIRTPGAEAETFDGAILATHTDTALAVLDDADPKETRLLGAFPFQTNRTFVHTDPGLMPRRRRVWSSWNVVEGGGANGGTDRTNPVSVTYWLNRLQSLEAREDVFVSLNPDSAPRDETIIEEVRFRHPQFDLAAIQAQKELPQIQGRRNVWFAGAWCGYGFHEDGLKAGIATARQIGGPTPFDDLPEPAPAYQPVS